MGNENRGRERPWDESDFGRRDWDERGATRGGRQEQGSSYQQGLGARRGPGGYGSGGDYDDSFQDQRNPQGERGNSPRHWQGEGYGGYGQLNREQERSGSQRGPDQRGYGRGNQFGQAGEYGRAHENDDRRRQYSFEDDDRRQDFGRGNERMRFEGDQRHSGSYAASRGENIHSRSADPGQSSYGGFSNEDPSFQRQQLEHYSGGRGYPGRHLDTQGNWQQGGGQDRQQNLYGTRRTSPKGYTRSDERVREDVCEQLSHSGLDVSEVSVTVSQGHVTLEGTVSDRRTKHAIEDCADGCMGVQDVDNRIRVQRDEGYSRGQTSMHHQQAGSQDARSSAQSSGAQSSRDTHASGGGSQASGGGSEQSGSTPATGTDAATGYSGGIDALPGGEESGSASAGASGSKGGGARTGAKGSRGSKA